MADGYPFPPPVLYDEVGIFTKLLEATRVWLDPALTPEILGAGPESPLEGDREMA